MKPDGGPAQPRVVFTRREDGISTRTEAPGMSIRDAFAMAALQGLLANPTTVNDLTQSSKHEYFAIISRNCFQYADAMLAERSKP